MKVHIIAVGKLRGPEAELARDYAERLTGGIAMREISSSTQTAETTALLKALPDNAVVALLDENGRDLTSREFAAQMAAWRDRGAAALAFVIGGADGLGDAVRAKGQFTLSLGRKTWPHRLARIMLLEQLYRAQQINIGHPYHRD